MTESEHFEIWFTSLSQEERAIFLQDLFPDNKEAFSIAVSQKSTDALLMLLHVIEQYEERDDLITLINEELKNRR